MRWMTEVRRAVDPATLRAVRTAQALVLEVLDRGRVRPVAMHWNLQLDFADTYLGDPARLADESYETVVRLIGLHREFVQRLFEVADTRDDPFVHDEARMADVLPFRTASPTR